MKNLLTWDYWSALRPDSLVPGAQKAFLIFLALLAVAAIVTVFIKIKGGLYRGFLKSLYGFFLWNTIIGLFLFFFDYETVPFLSARFWLAVWALAMAAWLVFIFRKLKKIPAQKKKIKEEEEKKKYLP